MRNPCHRPPLAHTSSQNFVRETARSARTLAGPPASTAPTRQLNLFQSAGPCAAAYARLRCLRHGRAWRGGAGGQLTTETMRSLQSASPRLGRETAGRRAGPPRNRRRGTPGRPGRLSTPRRLRPAGVIATRCFGPQPSEIAREGCLPAMVDDGAGVRIAASMR